MTNNIQNPNTPLPARFVAVMDDVFSRYSSLEPAREGLVQTFRSITHTFDRGGILYLCGNGGSFADAMHIKGELAKSFVHPRPLTDLNLIRKLEQSDIGKQMIDQLEQGLPVIVLGESHSLRSAYANDRNAEWIYAQELNAFARCGAPGVLMGISTSGNSKNVVAAVTLAKAVDMATVAFTGPRGGHLADIADIAWLTPGQSTFEIQENQIPLYHALCRMIEAYCFNGDQE